MHGLARLSESLRNNFDGDFIAFTNEETLGSPKHEDNPYAFKIYSIQKAIEAGYELILWLDCSVFAIAPVQPIFDIIKSEGYIMQDAGHLVGNWTNDFTLNYFGITRDEAMNIKCYGNAGFLGLSVHNSTAMQFFDKWDKSMQKGCFKGKWTNDEKTESEDERVFGHRHDLSAGSIIAYKLVMKYQPGDQILQYAGVYDKIANETIILKAQGI